MGISEEEQAMMNSRAQEIARLYPEGWKTAGQLGIPLAYDLVRQEDEACAFLRGIEHAKRGFFSTDEALAPEYEVTAYITGWRVYLRRSKSDRKQFDIEY